MRIAAIASAMLFATSAMALELGDAAPNFKNLPTADGKKISLDDMKKDVLVIAVTCNHCPVAKAYEDRLIQFAKDMGDNVDFVAVNVNLAAIDNLENMTKRAQEKGFNFPYAIDETQQIGKDLGARKTPEFFVFDKDHKLVYTGAFDDSMDVEQVTENFVPAAANAVLTGSQVPESTDAVGCGIRYEK